MIRCVIYSREKKEILLNNFDDLHHYYSTIVELDCRYNELIEIPSLLLCKKLKILKCSYNKLLTLPELPKNIEYIDCGHNNISLLSLFMNHTKLKYLNCSYNNISSLNIPDYLEYLICNNNIIRNLPTNLNNIKEINCSCNIITSIFINSNSILELYCNFNYLNKLNITSNKLKVLSCISNKLTDINIKYNISQLYCEHNPLLYNEYNSYHIIRINKFRYFYYSEKYKYKIFLGLIKKRHIKYKYELLEKSAIIMLNPKRIKYLLDLNYDINDICNNI